MNTPTAQERTAVTRLAWPACALFFALTSPALAGQPIDERAEMAPDGRVTVINISGDIDISTWGRAEVELTGELGDDSELVFEASGGDVRVEVETPDGGRFRSPEPSELILRVPEGASLTVTGVSSDIDIADTRGEVVVAETVSGDVTVRAESERVELTSVSGDVTFIGASPRTSVETVSGDIELDGVSGELEVSLVSGDVDLRGGRFDLGRFESVSGTLDLVMEVNAGGRVSVETMSGDALLSLPGEQAGEFRAQTFSGDIRTQFGSPQREKHGPGSRLEHVAGDGSAVIRVESFSGDVRLDKR